MKTARLDSGGLLRCRIFGVDRDHRATGWTAIYKSIRLQIRTNSGDVAPQIDSGVNGSQTCIGELTAVSIASRQCDCSTCGGAMDAAVNHPGLQASVLAQPFLAADVGGTHARVALVRASGDGDRGLEMLVCRRFDCADFAGLAELLRAFIDGHAEFPVRHCVLACAGQVMGDEVLNDNLAWPIHVSRLRSALAFDDVAVLNDFEALAYALDGMPAHAGRLLCGPDIQPNGPTLVIGPGTGLGAAVRLPAGDGAKVLTTEAGQMDFAPNTLREREILPALHRT